MEQSEGLVRLQSGLQKLRTNLTPDAFAVAVKTLLTFVKNVENHPQDEKYRKIQMSNSAFQKRLASHPGGLDCVQAIGFIMNEAGDALILTPNAKAWEQLVAAGRELEKAQQQGGNVSAPTAPSPMGGMGAAGGMDPNVMASMQQMLGGNPNLGDAVTNPAAMNQMAPMLQQIAQNPQLLQQAMSNPMLQQMAASNPMLQQVLSNPAMIQSMLSSPMAQQLLSNPAAMQQAMAGQGLGGMGGMTGGPSQGVGGNPGAMAGAGGLPTNPHATSTAAPTSSTVNTTPTSDEMTEEEMLAQAIQASLEQDNNSNTHSK